MSSSSSFRAERGRRSRDAADADAAAAHSIRGKMKSFFFRVLYFMSERGNRTYSEKTAFFSLFFMSPWHRPSVPLSKESEARHRNSSNICIQEKLQKYTRRLARTHARLKNFYILSSEEEEEREREREVRFIRALSFLLRREGVSSSKSLVLKIGTLLTVLPFLLKNPPRRTQVTHTQERIDKYAHI